MQKESLRRFLFWSSYFFHSRCSVIWPSVSAVWRHKFWLLSSSWRLTHFTRAREWIPSIKRSNTEVVPCSQGVPAEKVRTGHLSKYVCLFRFLDHIYSYDAEVPCNANVVYIRELCIMLSNYLYRHFHIADHCNI